MNHRLTQHPFRKTERILLGILILLWLSAGPARAAWLVNGDAYVSGSDPDLIVVTPLANNQVGSAWLDFALDLNLDFDITLAVNLGDRDANGADGIAIVLHNDPAGLSAIGNTGGGGEWMGLRGIVNALAVEIDTYQNASRGDPVCDHIGIDEIRDAASLPNHSGGAPQCADAGGANIEDGAEHLVRLNWNSTTQTLNVFWEGVLRFTYTNINIVNDIFNGAGSVYFGMVGSTGGAYNLQQFRSVVTSSQIVVTKSAAPATLDPGDPLTYSIVLENNSPITCFVTQIEDQLPAGFSYLAGTSAGLTTADPVVAGTTLTWNGSWILNPGDAIPLTFQSLSPAVPGLYYNTAIVRGANFLEVTSGATAAVTVGSDLSTSIKTVVDTNGGDAQPGDTLRYTITLNETAGRAATLVSVTDDMPPAVTGFTVTSIPAGAMDNSPGAGPGANGTGLLDVSGISVPANGSVAIEFEVTVDAAAPNGITIDNTAVISNPGGAGASPAAPTVTVIDSSVPATGSKPLYFYADPGNDLSRTPPAAAQPVVTIDSLGGSATWTLTPALAASLTINGSTGVIPVELYLQRNWSLGSSNRRMTVTLNSSSGEIGRIDPTNYALPFFAPTLMTFDIPVSGNVTLAPGETVWVTITNNTNQNNRLVYVYPESGGNYSRVVLEADTVINVDSTAFYSAAYPAVTTVADAAPGQTVYVRSTISDPFGSFDITGATLELERPDSTIMFTNQAMTEVDDSGLAVKTYEYALTFPFGGPQGIWTIRVTGVEGSEGVVTHTRTSTLVVLVPPNIMLVKSASSATANPGQIVTYTVQLTNTGGTATNVVVEDDLSPYTALRIAYNGSGSEPFELTPAGLGTAAYSHDNGATFNSNPLVSGDGGAPAGFDGTVTDWRITVPADMLNGTNYIIRYQVIVK